MTSQTFRDFHLNIVDARPTMVPAGIGLGK